MERCSSLIVVAAACAALLGCKPVPKPETQTGSTPAASPVEGVKPQDSSQPSASERPGAPAIGAIEAGQASGGANSGGAAAPTGGDRGTSAAAASAPR